MKQLFRTLSIFVLPLLVAACNTDYNFDNVSLEVTVGDTNGIAVPLGDTGKITVGELLKETGLETNQDGFYGFTYGDDVSYTAEIAQLPAITGLVPDISPIENSLLGGFSAEIGEFHDTEDLSMPSGLESFKGIELTQSILDMMGSHTFAMHYDPHTFNNTFSIELPAEVKSLEQVTFGENGEGSIIDLQFDLGGLAGVNQECHITKLSFELPAGFSIDKLPNDPLANYITISKSADSDTKNHFQIDDYSFTGSHITIDIIIRSVDLDHLTLDENNMVTINENVTFDLDADITIKAGTITTTSPYMEMKVKPVVHDATIIVNEIAHTLEFEEPIEQVIEIPEIVSRIDYLTIGKVAAPEECPKFSVDVELEGAPMDMIELRDVVITLPEFLDIDAPEGWTYNAGKLTNPLIEVHNDQTNHIIDLQLESISGLDIVDNKINLNSKIGLTATAAITDGTDIHITTNDNVLKLTPIITLDDMTIKEVSGIIDPDLSEMLPTQEITLGDFTSSLEGIDMDLNIESPLLTLSVENPIGVGIDASVNLVAYKGKEIVKDITTPTIKIEPAVGNTPTTTDIRITGNPSNIPDGLTYYLVEDLTDLIATLPDKIVVSLAAETNKDTIHTLTLQDSYTFNVSYNVEAALKFDSEKDGSINYEVLIEDVDLTALADLNITVESLILNVASESTLPINLTMDVELLDENDAPIECVTSSTKGNIAGSTTEEATLSECEIILNIATPSAESSQPSPWAEIARTKKIRCNLQGATLAGGGLKPEQYLTAKLSLLLDKGITIDLGTLLPEEEEKTPTQK